jgi:hypothetical protein
MNVKVPEWVVKQLIDYMLKDEKKDYEENRCPEDHIYLAVDQLHTAYLAACAHNVNNDVMLDHWYDVHGGDMLCKAAIDAGFDKNRVDLWLEKRQYS